MEAGKKEGKNNREEEKSGEKCGEEEAVEVDEGKERWSRWRFIINHLEWVRWRQTTGRKETKEKGL